MSRRLKEKERLAQWKQKQEEEKEKCRIENEAKAKKQQEKNEAARRQALLSKGTDADQPRAVKLADELMEQKKKEEHDRKEREKKENEKRKKANELFLQKKREELTQLTREKHAREREERQKKEMEEIQRRKKETAEVKMRAELARQKREEEAVRKKALEEEKQQEERKMKAALRRTLREREEEFRKREDQRLQEIAASVVKKQKALETHEQEESLKTSRIREKHAEHTNVMAKRAEARRGFLKEEKVRKERELKEEERKVERKREHAKQALLRKYREQSEAELGRLFHKARSEGSASVAESVSGDVNPETASEGGYDDRSPRQLKLSSINAWKGSAEEGAKAAKPKAGPKSKEVKKASPARREVGNGPQQNGSKPIQSQTRKFVNENVASSPVVSRKIPGRKGVTYILGSRESSNAPKTQPKDEKLPSSPRSTDSRGKTENQAGSSSEETVRIEQSGDKNEGTGENPEHSSDEEFLTQLALGGLRSARASQDSNIDSQHIAADLDEKTSHPSAEVGKGSDKTPASSDSTLDEGRKVPPETKRQSKAGDQFSKPHPSATSSEGPERNRKAMQSPNSQQRSRLSRPSSKTGENQAPKAGEIVKSPKRIVRSPLQPKPRHSAEVKEKTQGSPRLTHREQRSNGNGKHAKDHPHSQQTMRAEKKSMSIQHQRRVTVSTANRPLRRAHRNSFEEVNASNSDCGTQNIDDEPEDSDIHKAANMESTIETTKSLYQKILSNHLEVCIYV